MDDCISLQSDDSDDEEYDQAEEDEFLRDLYDSPLDKVDEVLYFGEHLKQCQQV